MPKGPNGQKRPADGVGMSVMVARIATGEEEETSYVSKNRRKSGEAGARARMSNTSAKQRSEIATKAAEARWKGNDEMNDTQAPCSELDAIYAEKRNEGLFDVKFFHKNLDEAAQQLLEDDLVAISKSIRDGAVSDFDLGPLRIKKAS